MHSKCLLIMICLLFKPLLGEIPLYRHAAAGARRPRWNAPGE